jgi:hypothetical protein
MPTSDYPGAGEDPSPTPIPGPTETTEPPAGANNSITE